VVRRRRRDVGHGRAVAARRRLDRAAGADPRCADRQATPGGNRHLFDWLVTGQIVPHNPAASVRGPSHTTKKGKTPVLDATAARQLLDRIDVSTPIGLRDRALIALMVFSFARVGAALAMRVDDVYVQHRRLWVRVREKGDTA
jgi:site-specific recombinase XerC